MTAYATTSDLHGFGLPARALEGIDTDIQDDHLTKASGLIDSYLRAQYTLPLVEPYPEAIKSACITIAAYTLLIFRGFNPDEYDANFRQRYEDVLRWLELLSKGVVKLDTGADSSSNTQEGAPVLVSGSTRPVRGKERLGNLRGW